MSNPILAILVNHLWQSTLFAGVIAGLAVLVRKNSPRVRYLLWLAASLKFLLPFALLAAIGAKIPWPAASAADPVSPLPRVVELAGDFTVPMVGELPFPAMGVTIDTTFQLLIALIVALTWATGALVLAVRWLMRWLEIRRALRQSTALTDVDFAVPVHATPQQFEPGVVGIFSPKLLLPTGLETRLSPEQMRAVLAHERCHLRWRDNLTASLHMIVQTLFWYFPLVWWIGARLIEERERACDEQVVREGHSAQGYAEGILQVCEHYITSRLPCVSGISGADLRKRIEHIARRTMSVELDGPRRFAIRAMACFAVAAPIGAGMLSGNSMQAMFSLGPNTAAQMQYWRVHSAMSDGMQLNVCPAPSGLVQARQQALEALVARLAPKDDKALLYAVAANSKPEVRRLLAGGAARTGDGFLFPSSLMHVAAQFGDPSMLTLLRDSGFAIDGWNEDGLLGVKETPLMLAISRGRLDNARWFIQQGVDVNASNKHGYMALTFAMVTCQHKDLVRELVQAGSKPNLRVLRIADSMGYDLRTDPTQPGPPLQSWAAKAESSATADLDGDGKADPVALHASIDQKRLGVFVKLSSLAPARWTRAAESGEETSAPQLTRISVTEPGVYRIRGKCSASCSPSEPKHLTLEHAGIEFSDAHGIGALLYWDNPARKFRRVWLDHD